MKRKIILAIKISLTVLIFVYIFNKIPFPQILKELSTIKIFLFLLATALSIPVILLSSLQTKYLTSIQKIVISYWEILKVYLTAGFYSLFIPGSILGGAVKWYKFQKHGSKTSAAVVVVFNRYLELFTIIFIGIIFSIPTLINSDYKYLLIVWFTVLILLFASYFILLNAEALKKIEFVFSKIPLGLNIKNKTKNFFQAMHEFQNLTLKDHVKILSIMFLYHFLNIIGFYFLAESVNVSLNILVLGWIRSIVMISNLLPISYSGLGVREGIIIFLFQIYGVPASEALVISLLSFAKNLFLPLVGGILELKDFLLGKSYKSTKETNSFCC